MSRQVIGPVRHLEEIDSTNRYLADEARAGAASGLVAIARYQTAGRGRLDRRWEAPPGANLLMSVLLRTPPDLGPEREPEREPFQPFHLTVATALAASDACRETAGVEAGLKWPNDLVVDAGLDSSGKFTEGPLRGQALRGQSLRGESSRGESSRGELKLAGILAEVVSSTDGLPAIVVGLGLNVGWPGTEPAEPEMKGATSLVRLSKGPLDTDSVAEAVLDHLDRRITDLFFPGGATKQMTQYRRRCVTIGKTVRVEQAAGSFIGRADRITDEGHLVVDTSEGRHEEVTAGDVVHVHVSEHFGVGLSEEP